MTDPVYCYPPDFRVLKNKFGLQNADELDKAERIAVQQRIEQGSPQGRFDLPHLQAIHRHLFQDVYEWAGQIRTTSLQKGESVFMPPGRIDTGFSDIHRRIVEQKHLRGQSPDQFAQNAGTILGDVCYVHPFREGNGRTQLQYLKQLGAQAGHNVDLTRIGRDPWIAASIAAHGADYAPMSACIKGALGQSQSLLTAKTLDADQLKALRDVGARYASGRGQDNDQERDNEQGQDD